MASLRKALSIILGSSEETIVDAKTQLHRALGSERLSNDFEKDYILDVMKENIVNSGLLYSMPLENIVLFLLNRYLDTWNETQLHILNRVLVYYYGYKLGDMDTLPRAIENLAFDLKVYRNL